MRVPISSLPKTNQLNASDEILILDTTDSVDPNKVATLETLGNVVAEIANTNIDYYVQEITQTVNDLSNTANNSANTSITYSNLSRNYSNVAQNAANNAVAVTTGGTASLTPEAGKIPLADAQGVIDLNWLGDIYASTIRMTAIRVNDIGIPGTIGFGIGICPELPAGYAPYPGTFTLGSDQYGHYQYLADGSECGWVPAFYYRIGHADNPTYARFGVNSIDVKPFSHFPSVEAANAQGYALQRAFIDGGEIVPGFMRDMFHNSNNGGVASSIKLGNPLSSAAAHNPFSGLTGTPSNTYGGAIAAAKTRGPEWFPESAFMSAAIAMLTLAHAQAATSTAACAWYDPAGVTNFPKGNNNNALGDVNDPTVSFISDGYSSAAKAGGGSPYAKTTHNGQPCGFPDVNGNLYRINLGMTCVATSKAITNASQTNPVQITAVGHGFLSGGPAIIASVGGMTVLNNRIFTVTVIDPDTLVLDGVDGTGFAAYTSGGSITTGKFYSAKPATRIEDYTAGATLATDHWGAVGTAATMDEVAVPMRTDHPNNGIVQLFGNGANQVLDPATAGPGYALASLALPIYMGASTSGSSLYGQDYFYQNIRNDLCLVSGGDWTDGSASGVFARDLSRTRVSYRVDVGLVSASYPVRPSGS